MTQSLQVLITRCYLYGRVSTREQVETGHGVEAQLLSCDAFAKARGWEVVGRFTDPGISGGEEPHRRPGLKAVLEAHRADPGSCIVSYSLSRLSRSLKLTSELLLDGEKSIRFVSVTEAFDSTTCTGRMMLAIVAAFAQYEREIGSERTRMGIEHARSLGHRLGPKRLVDTSPETVMLIHKLQKKGYTLRGIAEALNKASIPTKKGGRWSHVQVLRTARQDPDAARAEQMVKETPS